MVGLSAVLEKLGIRSQKINDLPMDIIMRINLKLRYQLFKNQEALKLLEEIINEFIRYSKEEGFIPVLLWMPQKDDILFIKRNGHYYNDFIREISKKILTIDLTRYLINSPKLSELYQYDNEYGGHFSSYGNKFVAEIIYNILKREKILEG